ncbi:MAG TPA: adenylate/guanylate cyclase domain-containing protein [Acidimicrobiia bacterium]|nr:adenylate/guanylate cyclase domain-containing protein [Acidimicrobiia bacterium]
MTGPDVRYVSTDDGVSLAYWELGQGQPLVLVHNFSFSHAELEWRVPTLASFYRELAERYRVVRFDPRGIGLSGDPPGGWGTTSDAGIQRGMSTVEMALDIEAVAGALGLVEFALLAVGPLVPVAIVFAATRPASVTELILWNGIAKIEGSYLDPTVRTGQAVRDLGLPPSERPRFAIGSWAPADELARLKALVDAAVGRYFSQPMPVQSAWDAEPYLGQVSSRTLVVCSPNEELNRDKVFADSRQLATTIPQARLRIIDVDGPYWMADGAIDVLSSFVDAGSGQPEGFRTVVFADVVGSTEFTNRVGDREARSAIRQLEHRLADLSTRHRGRLVKHLGDGSLVSFRSNTDALRFALDLQSHENETGLRMRVGMAAGEPLSEDGDIHGAVVAAASRLCELAGPGEVAVAESVYHLATGKGFRFERKGEFELKGFANPTVVWLARSPKH